MMLLEKQYHDDLKMELQDVSSINKQSSAEDMESKEELLRDVQQSAMDSEDLSRLMMSRKKRGLAKAIEVTLLAMLCFIVFYCLTCNAAVHQKEKRINSSIKQVLLECV